MRINETLSDFKQNNRLTYHQIAELLGVEGKNPRQTVRRWALGHRIPRNHYLTKIETLIDGYTKK